jgi:hypothetical protein
MQFHSTQWLATATAVQVKTDRNPIGQQQIKHTAHLPKVSNSVTPGGNTAASNSAVLLINPAPSCCTSPSKPLPIGRKHSDQRLLRNKQQRCHTSTCIMQTLGMQLPQVQPPNSCFWSVQVGSGAASSSNTAMHSIMQWVPISGEIATQRCMAPMSPVNSLPP